MTRGETLSVPPMRKPLAIKRKTPGRGRACSSVEAGERLLDLAFAELDVLAHDGIVLLQHHLFGLGAGVLLGDIEEAGVRRRVQADLDGSRFGHGVAPSAGQPSDA